MTAAMGATPRPAAADVAARAIILKHVAVYALLAPPRPMLESMMATWSDNDRRGFATEGEVRRNEFWSRLGPLRHNLSPWEREYSHCTMLTMSLRQQVDASWRTEAFQVLAWALGVAADIPPYDVEADPDILKAFPPQQPDAFVATAQLRPVLLIDEARELAELWHWRSRTRQLIEDGEQFPQSPQMRVTGLRSFDDVVRTAASSAAQEGRIATAQGDFAAFGKAYRDLSPDEWAKVRSISSERHFALNWLCGYAPEHQWDDTPTDT